MDGDILESMNIQIIGTKKCRETRRAIRFFKERRIGFHLVDLSQRAVSPGELDNILRRISPEALLDKDGSSYKKRGMAYKLFDIREEILEDPGLMKTPVIRNGKEVTLGHSPEEWERWLKEV